MKRRNNRLIIENLPLVEAYIERWLTVIRDFEIFGARYCVDSSTLRNEKVKPSKTSTAVVPLRLHLGVRRSKRSELTACAYPGFRDAEVVQHIIASSIRLYVVDNNAGDFWRRESGVKVMDSVTNNQRNFR